MANTTFQGPVISKNGFYNTGPGNIVDADANTSLTVASHAGRIVLNDAAGAVTTHYQQSMLTLILQLQDQEQT